METELLETKELPQTASAPVPLGEAVLYPGLCLKQHGQQTWRGSAPLPCAGETLPGALRPDVESTVKKRYGPVRVHPDEGHKNRLRNGTLPCGDRLRAGAVQMEKRRLQGELTVALSI